MPHLPVVVWILVGVTVYALVMMGILRAFRRATGVASPKPPVSGPVLVTRNTAPPPGYVLGYFREAAPARGIREKLRFGWYGVDGRKGLEVVFQWESGSIRPVLLAPPDTWADMMLFSAVLKDLADLPSASLSPENVCIVLHRQSFADLTGEKACESREKFLASLLEAAVPLRFYSSPGHLRIAACY